MRLCNVSYGCRPPASIELFPAVAVLTMPVIRMCEWCLLYLGGTVSDIGALLRQLACKELVCNFMQICKLGCTDLSHWAGNMNWMAVSQWLVTGASVLHCRALTVLHFYASWAPQCQQVDDVLVELHKESSVATPVKFLKVLQRMCTFISRQP